MDSNELYKAFERMVKTDVDARVSARISDIEAEAKRKIAEVKRQEEIDRNGGYSDAFKEWGQEVLDDFKKKSERDDPTARIINGLDKVKGQHKTDSEPEDAVKQQTADGKK